MNTCKTCRYYRAEKAGEQAAPYGYCFNRPPVVLLMPVPVVPTGRISKLNPPPMEAELKPASVRPMVREGDICAEYFVF